MIADAGGAAYSPELTHEVTHLVVGPSFNSRDELLQNGKYMSAKQINNKRAKRQDGSRPIWIVWGEWLEHCLCAFGRVREEPYSAEIVSERKAIHPPPGELSQDIISRRQSASPRKMKNKNTRDDHAQIKSKRKLIKQETLPSMDVSGPTTVKRDRAAEDHSADISEKRMKLEPPATTPPGGIGDMDDSSTDALERLEPVAVKRQSPSLSADPLLSLTSNRASSLGPRPTMKKQRSSTQMELMGVQDLIAQKLEQASAPPVAGGSSNLVQHIDNGSLEDRQEGSSSGAGSRLSRMGKDRSNKFISKQKVAGQSTAEYDSDSSRTLPLPATDKKPGIEDHSAAQGQRSLEPAPTTDNDDAPPATIFSGMQFYIVPNEFPSGLVPRIEVAITARGGRVVTSDSPEVDYVMCKGVS